MDWHSIHVHYYDDDIDDLLLDVVRPLFDELSDGTAARYFVRHWKRGPHLRLHLRAARETFETVVRPRAAAALRGFLDARPPRCVPDPEQLLPLHQRLAKLELEDGPLLPWREDRSIHVAPYDRRLHVLGNEVAADLLAEFLSETTGLAFEMLEQLRSGGQRLRLAFDLMIAVAHALSGFGILGGFASYRSHGEAFLTAWPEGSGRRAEWDSYYRRHSAALTDRVRKVVATLDGDAPVVPFVQRWAAVLGRFHVRGRGLIEDGRLSMETPQRARDMLAAAPITEVSPYHRKVYGDEWWMRHVNPSSGFTAYRLALNYNYQQLTRLGVTPMERALLCHLAANAVEELYGVTALELVERRFRHPAVFPQVAS